MLCQISRAAAFLLAFATLGGTQAAAGAGLVESYGSTEAAFSSEAQQLPSSCPFRRFPVVPDNTSNSFCSGSPVRTSCSQSDSNIMSEDECSAKGCCWDPTSLVTCACPSSGSVKISLEEHAHNQKKGFTVFKYGVACEDAYAFGLLTEGGLNVAVPNGKIADWTTTYFHGRPALAPTSNLMCEGKTIFELRLNGKIGACPGQAFAKLSDGGYEVSNSVVPCKQAAPHTAQAMVKDFVASAAVPAAGAAVAAKRAGASPSSRDPVTRASHFTNLAPVKAVPATRSADPAGVAVAAAKQLVDIKAEIQSAPHCAELGDALKRLRDASHSYAQEFGRVVLRGLHPGDEEACTDIGKQVVEAFEAGVDRWTSISFCAKGIKGAMTMMREASEEWTHLYAALGKGGLRAAEQSSKDWAAALSSAGRVWIQMSTTNARCDKVPSMVAILKQMVTVARSAVNTWTEYLDNVEEAYDVKMEVMATWMTALEELMQDARGTAQTWSTACSHDAVPVQRLEAASMALADFVRHFSAQSTFTSQLWSKILQSENEAATLFSLRASLFAASTMYISDLAMISHAMSTAYALRAQADTAKASEVWAETFNELIQDAEDKAMAWQGSCGVCTQRGVQQELVEEAWTSFFNVINVSTSVAGEGWTHSASHNAAGQASGAWDSLDNQLSQTIQKVSSMWATATPAMDEDEVLTSWSDDSANSTSNDSSSAAARMSGLYIYDLNNETAQLCRGNGTAGLCTNIVY
mmetsp:Transcript_2319/g.4855  ORF Transcript_2319/g.4855 Transcript_2319/m.4855 type:complete len:749 (-) Transcript_2319:114-2360(-)